MWLASSIVRAWSGQIKMKDTTKEGTKNALKLHPFKFTGGQLSKMTQAHIVEHKRGKKHWTGGEQQSI